MLGNIHIFCHLLIFSKLTLKNLLQVRSQSVKQLRPDQARCLKSVGPDLGSNCLQRLAADDTSRQSVKRYLLLCDKMETMYNIMFVIRSDKSCYFQMNNLLHVSH